MEKNNNTTKTSNIIRNALFTVPLFCGLIFSASYYANKKQETLSLWDFLNKYGFDQLEQKEAIEFLLKKSGASDAEALLMEKVSTKEQLLEKIVTFVEVTQKYFNIRTSNQERWEIQIPEWIKEENLQDKILNKLQLLKLTTSVMPSSDISDSICILGATNKTMKLRLKFAGELYQNGELSAKTLILLSGERYVSFDKENQSIDGTKDELSAIANSFGKDLLQLTETDLLIAAYEKSLLNNKLTLVVIDTPKGNLPRPTTETTTVELIKWLKENNSVNSITFVSNQPYVAYQKAIITMIFKRESIDANFEVIGSQYLLSSDNKAEDIKNLIGAIGSQIYAQTPAIIDALKLDNINPELQQRLTEIYKTQPLIYKTLFKPR